jgi:hypothetical protein
MGLDSMVPWRGARRLIAVRLPGAVPPSILGLLLDDPGPSSQPALASVENQSNVIQTHSRRMPWNGLERN